MTVMKNLLTTAVALLTIAILLGCSPRPAPRGETLSFSKLVRELTEFEHLPLIDGRDIRLYSSYDRTGGNNDFNQFAGPGSEPGWVTLVNLKGPGCIRRFWTTGTDPGHPIRIYIDGETRPRIDSTLDALFGETAPWTPPLAQYINLCYYSYVPIPYAKSIRIEMRQPNQHPLWGPRRIFFQIAAETFPPGTRVESYPRDISAEELNAAREVAEAWKRFINSREVVFTDGAKTAVVEPGSRQSLFSHEGAGTVREWRLLASPAQPDAWTRIEQEALLQDTVLRVYYNGQSEPSIETPLGDFFANPWRKRAHGSLWFTSGEGGYACRLPMPFASGICFEIENAADRPISVRFEADLVPDRDPRAGYLHAEYRRSGPDSGRPHVVAQTQGRGKFLGCFLGVTGLEQSWWILEGDERMWVDNHPQPVWLGTGLEDYFNGGWYYRGSVFGALSGNFDRAPFRVAQYRFQHPDPVSFESVFQMDFERMNDERTGLPVRGWFQSVAYFYLSEPRPVAAVPSNRAERRAVEHPNDRATTMLQLFELERANDFHGAMRLIEEYGERYPDASENGVYRLRHLEYRRHLGMPVGETDYEPFLNGKYGEAAQAQARQLVWFYEAPDRALLGLYANARTLVSLNNQPLLSGDHPFRLFVAGITLTNGLQRLAAQAEMVRADPWVQIGIRTHDGFVGTGPGTWTSREVRPGWRTQDPAPPVWHAVDLRQIPRGVPDAPYIGGIANAFILLQSKSYPVSGLDWQYYRGTAYFRSNFEFPVRGYPSFSRMATGLIE